MFKIIAALPLFLFVGIPLLHSSKVANWMKKRGYSEKQQWFGFMTTAALIEISLCSVIGGVVYSGFRIYGKI